MDFQEGLSSFLDTLKGWFYTCSLIVLLLNLFTDVLPELLVNIAMWAMFVAFIWDIIVSIVGIVNMFVEGELSFTGVLSSLIEILMLALVFVLAISYESVFPVFNITKAMEGMFVGQWIATCIVLYHFAVEIVSLPVDIIALFSDEGDF